jgi:hypothetical protein
MVTLVGRCLAPARELLSRGGMLMLSTEFGWEEVEWDRFDWDGVDWGRIG